MSDATIIAMILLCGVFLILIITILKSGVADAIKMWNVMGAITGVAFGAIISFYFTNEANKFQISQLKTDKKEVLSAFNNTIDKASKAKKDILQLQRILHSTLGALPERERVLVRSQIDKTSNTLKEIVRLQNKFGTNNSSVPVKENP
jgi:hypothetical protein